jgi:calcineurin-like phosphoesterase family protein
MIINAVTADQHFGHMNIIEYESRPFTLMEEMVDHFVEQYNLVIEPYDTCLWLGDAFFTPFDEALHIMDRLNGHKVIVRGNHDRSATWLAKAGFDLVFNEPVHFQIAGRQARACHYPYWESRDPRHKAKNQDKYPTKVKGEILVHGHIHGQDTIRGNQIHVGVDARDYRPVLWESLEEEAEGI